MPTETEVQGLAHVLPAICCILMLSACAPQPRYQQPVRTRAVPPPAGRTEIAAGAGETGAAVAGQGLPRVMVVVKAIPKDDIVTVNDRLLETGPAEALIGESFRSRGFPVVDPAAVRQSLHKDRLRMILEGDDQAAIEVGLAAEAEVVVAGTVQETRERQASAGTTEAVDVLKVRLAARAVNTATGVVLGSTLLESEGQDGKDTVLRRAADSAVAELSARIAAAWSGRTNITEIYADNADYQRVQLLKSVIMNEVPEIDSVTTLALTGRSAVVEVFSRVTSEELLARMNHCITAIPFVVKNSSANRIDIQFEDAPEQCEPELK